MDGDWNLKNTPNALFRKHRHAVGGWDVVMAAAEWHVQDP